MGLRGMPLPKLLGFAGDTGDEKENETQHYPVKSQDFWLNPTYAFSKLSGRRSTVRRRNRPRNLPLAGAAAARLPQFPETDRSAPESDYHWHRH